MTPEQFAQYIYDLLMEKCGDNQFGPVGDIDIINEVEVTSDTMKAGFIVWLDGKANAESDLKITISRCSRSDKVF